eukprot:TRINITY_DN6464_c0_g1_i1.p2 TRINITY_DN6464_c0_g1~~TRINITY_DN6464_c0_g1_i1.p2  ORF type:complete len:119 (-),score=28.67 TRINITY_DN6464_c0_g1_i1:31-387(-)
MRVGGISNWGCGVFAGDLELKAMLQLLAASQADRPLLYLTFGDQDLSLRLQRLTSILTSHKTTVGELFDAITKICAKFEADWKEAFLKLEQLPSHPEIYTSLVEFFKAKEANQKEATE